MAHLTLNDDRSMPQLGMGTWQIRNAAAAMTVRTGLDLGFELVDTAAAYDNERGVGDGIRDTGTWVTTKLWNNRHDDAPAALDESLALLGLDAVDLYLMHWPSSTDPEDSKKHYPDWDFVDTWRELQKLVDTGKVRSLGVSNFGIKNLERLLSAPSTKVCGPFRETSSLGVENPR